MERSEAAGAPHVGFTCGGFDFEPLISLGFFCGPCCKGALNDWIDREKSWFSFRVEGEAAPGPVIGMLDQLSCHWIGMHVFEFLSSFLAL